MPASGSVSERRPPVRAYAYLYLFSGGYRSAG